MDHAIYTRIAWNSITPVDARKRAIERSRELSRSLASSLRK